MANDPTSITMFPLGNKPGYIPYPITPSVQPQSWATLFNRLPRHLACQNNIIAALQGSTCAYIRRAHLLGGEVNAQLLNSFLRELNARFPARVNTQRSKDRPAGATTVDRELAASTKNSLERQFGVDSRAFHHISSALGQHPGAAAGTLTLAATGPNLTWEHSYAKQACDKLVADAVARFGPNSSQAQQEERTRMQAQQNHKAGSAEWHDVVVYVRQGRTFIYDPSAVSYNTLSGMGRTVGQQIQTDTVPAVGVEGGGIANINMALALWRRGFNSRGPDNQGKLGTRSGRMVWIGGGGNVLQLVMGAPGEEDVYALGSCRPMCGNWMVLVHTLQWVSEQGWAQRNLSEQNCANARFNLDWLLGGLLTGESNEWAVAQKRRLDWVRVYVH